MTMLEYLERDRERVISGLQMAKTPDKAQQVITEEMDRLLLLYNDGCQVPARREAAAAMLQTVRLSASLVDTLGQAEVWEMTAAEAADGAHKAPLLAKILLGGGALSLAVSFLLAVFLDPHALRATDLLLALLLAAASAGLMWLAGSRMSGGHSLGSRVGGRKPISSKDGGLAQQAAYRIEQQVEPKRIYTSLHNTIYAVDRNLENILPDQAGQDANADGVAEGCLSDSELELFAALLEAEACGDGSYALQRLTDIRFYLHKRGIEAVEYNGQNGEMFDFMPSRDRRTIRPALVCDGKVIRRGVAAGGR